MVDKWVISLIADYACRVVLLLILMTHCDAMPGNKLYVTPWQDQVKQMFQAAGKKMEQARFEAAVKREIDRKREELERKYSPPKPLLDLKIYSPF
jgi:hypothetical protein